MCASTPGPPLIALVTMPEVADKPHPYMTPMERDMSGSEKPSFSGALAVGRELDLLLPDSPAVRDAYAQVGSSPGEYGMLECMELRLELPLHGGTLIGGEQLRARG